MLRSILKTTAVISLLFMLASVAFTQSGEVITAWTADGTLNYGYEGARAPIVLATGDIIAPYLSPDGETVAYTAGSGGLPSSLWAVREGEEAQQLVMSEQIGDATIAEVAWANSDTLFLNTTVIQAPFGANPRNDLYRVDVNTAKLSTMLAAGNGGAFSISPDRQHIALVNPGGFDQLGVVVTDGTIRIVDLEGGDVATMAFEPIQTGSHGLYYPEVTWLPDGESLYTVIPPGTLYYDSTQPEINTMAVWQLDLDGSTAQIGEIPFGYTSVPVWSSSREQLMYAVSPPSATIGTVVYIAQPNGTEPEIVIEGQTTFFRWSQHGERFVSGNGITLAIGDMTDPQRLTMPGRVLDVALLTDQKLVVSRIGESGVTLEVGTITADGSEIEFVTVAEFAGLSSTITFDAVIRGAG